MLQVTSGPSITDVWWDRGDVDGPDAKVEVLFEDFRVKVLLYVTGKSVTLYFVDDMEDHMVFSSGLMPTRKIFQQMIFFFYI